MLLTSAEGVEDARKELGRKVEGILIIPGAHQQARMAKV